MSNAKYIKGGSLFFKKIDELKKKYSLRLEYGFFGDVHYEENKINNSTVAFFNEFGTVNMPQRPFFRFANITAAQKIKNIIKNQKMLDYNLMSVIGQRCVTNMQYSIKGEGINYVPNKPSTLKLKDGDIPLIDTETMVNSVNFKVTKL